MRWQPTSPLDDQGFIDGDRAWQGMDNTRDKPLVQPGMLSYAQNTRLRTGKAKQRLGTTIPASFNPSAGYANFLVASGVFRDPNGEERMLIAPAGVKYLISTADGKDPVQIDYDGAITSTNGSVWGEIVQAFDKVLFLRFPVVTGENLVWDGDITHKWQIVTLSGTGSTLIPAMNQGRAFNNRVVYYNVATGFPGRDQFIVSDNLDYTSYSSTTQPFRANSAQGDYITSVSSYFRGSLLIWKYNSIIMATDLGLDLSGNLVMGFRILAPSMGSTGLAMPLEVGGDYIFLSPNRGFYRLSEVIQEQIVTLALPISEPIQPIIDNINWYLTGLFGCSQCLGEYAFFAVALGKETTALNAILVYNTQSQKWESVDTWADPGFSFHRLHLANYNGVQRLYAVDNTNSMVYLLYEGVRDELKNGDFSVPYKIVTRGYFGDDSIGFKKFGRVRVSISTYDPETTVTAITDGYNERFPLSDGPIVKDRDRYYTHAADAYDPASSDPTAPFREDYSIANVDNVAIEDFEELPVGQLAFLPGTEAATSDDRQESVESFWAQENGRWLALEIENVEGVCEVQAVSVEGSKIANTVRAIA